MLLLQLKDPSAVQYHELVEMYAELTSVYNGFIDLIAEAVMPVEGDLEQQLEELSKRFDATKRGLSLAHRLSPGPQKQYHFSRILSNMNVIRGMLNRVTKNIEDFSNAQDAHDHETDMDDSVAADFHRRRTMGDQQVAAGAEQEEDIESDPLGLEQEEQTHHECDCCSAKVSHLHHTTVSGIDTSACDKCMGYDDCDMGEENEEEAASTIPWTRQEAKALDTEIRKHCVAQGHNADGLMDSCKIVVKRSGPTKLVYSINTSDAKAFKKCGKKYLESKGLTAKARMASTGGEKAVVSFTVQPRTDEHSNEKERSASEFM